MIYTFSSIWTPAEAHVVQPNHKVMIVCWEEHTWAYKTVYGTHFEVVLLLKHTVLDKIGFQAIR